DGSNLDSALAVLAVRGAQGLIVTSDGVYVAQGKALAEGAIKHGFPAIFVFRDQVQAGGLLARAGARRGRCCRSLEAEEPECPIERGGNRKRRRSHWTQARLHVAPFSIPPSPAPPWAGAGSGSCYARAGSAICSSP